VMVQHEQVECPVTHRFTDGMYVRQIFMPEGILVASKVHKTEHFFTILKGRVSVKCGDKLQELEAGHIGVTKPGTHRLLYIHEDTVWVTFHPNPDNLTSLKELEEKIIEPHSIPELPCRGSLLPSL
jgi:quercetin dioxygenase-like cupin family protein